MEQIPLTQFTSIISDLRQSCQAELDAVEAILMESIGFHHEASRAMAGDAVRAGGKRIRPLMYILTCRLLGVKTTDPKHLSLACASELIHTASLLHDDVIDQASTRRGKPTINARFDNKSSILLGDLFYSTASISISRTGVPIILELFSDAIHKMTIGELLQDENTFNPDITIDTYTTILKYKTAFLMAASMESALILENQYAQESEAKISPNKILPDFQLRREWLRELGMKIGLLFQLVDDVLDYTSTDSLTGKDRFNDLIEGKITLPVIYLLNSLGSKESGILKQMISSRSIDIDSVKRWVDELGIMNTCYETIHQIESECRDMLIKINPDNHREFDDLITLITHRLT